MSLMHWAAMHFLKTHEPRCPQCGRKRIAPSVVNDFNMDAEHIIFWCSDTGHWSGDETEVEWVKKGGGG